MELALPNLTVIDRAVPYRYNYVEIPIEEEDEPLVRDAAHLDLPQSKPWLLARRGGARRLGAQALHELSGSIRILQIDIGSRFILPPGDPSPFVRRDVGAVNCGTFSGVAAVYCAVMSRR